VPAPTSTVPATGAMPPGPLPPWVPVPRPAPADQRRTEPLAVASFVLSLLSLAGTIVVPLVFAAPIMSVAGIVLSFAAIDRIEHSGGPASDLALAKAGRIITIITLILGLIETVAFLQLVRATQNL
jgi:hypothetical protein